MRFSINKLSLAAATAAFLIGAAAPTFAQTATSAPNATAQAAPASQPLTKAEQRKQARAQRKAERKAARAKNSAELKTLEQNGYNPSRDNPNYPEDIQNAEKKANGAAGASQ